MGLLRHNGKLLRFSNKLVSFGGEEPTIQLG